MRSPLHLNKLIGVSCIIFFILLNSCHPYVSGRSSLVSVTAPEVIHIVDGDTASGNLQIKDVFGNPADTFEINAGENIRWLLGKNQVIVKITNIYKKPTTNQYVFSAAPDSTGGSLNWAGTIAPDASGKAEYYNIDWIDKNGITHTFDPKIQVR